MPTFTRKITGLTCKPLVNGMSNVVTSVQWSYEGTDGAFTTAMSGITDLPDPNPASFNTFETLTENVVSSWLDACTEPAVLASYADQMTNWLAAQHSPSVVDLPLPWGS